MITLLALPCHRADLMELLCAKMHQSGKKINVFHVRGGSCFLG